MPFELPRFHIESLLDPPITINGVNEARVTGEFLKKHFETNHYNFDKVIIECSPFLKCIMTAAHLAPVLGVEEITVNYQATDFLAKPTFEQDPMPELLY